ncbi:phage tail spike protein [Salipaludibacillus sp. HK11]|uniref:phage tail spike protein n=1 Tax=Salipaludibacillus sp. HK11 TaxID=3394320 RepID=UPI0039FC81B2
MYKITINNDGEESIIHDSQVNDIKLESGSIKTEINKIDSFTFSFFPNNPGFGKTKPFTTLIKVRNMKTDVYEFEGRVLGPSDSMNSSGLFNNSYECEGELGYLHDSMQRHMEFRGTPLELLSEILIYHNSQVEEYKRFEVGEMNVTNSTDNLYLYLSAQDNSFETIKDKLIDSIGGELQIRKSDGVRFLDLLERVGEDKNTEIRIAKNLISMSRDVDPTDIVTRLTPLGTRIESEDEEATDASQARLTIESVNEGLPYLDDEALIAEFGVQGGSITWDDVTQETNLKSNGVNWLANQKVAQTQYKISALDLFLIGLDIDSFEKGNSYPVKNVVMGIDERLRVIGKTLDINSPQDASLVIGDKFKTLNEYQSDANKSAEKVVELENIQERQSQSIGVLKTELNSVENAVQQVQIELEEGDLPALEAAIDSLNEAIDNLNDAIDAIPVYDPSTQTEDGLMSATDKTKLDSLESYDLATELEDGLMSSDDKTKLDGFVPYDKVTETEDGLMAKEDKTKLNKVTVVNAVDLDDMLVRIEALENGV